MKYHTLFFGKLEKMPQNLLSAAVVIGALRVKKMKQGHDKDMHNQPRLRDINSMWVESLLTLHVISEPNGFFMQTAKTMIRQD